MRTIIRVMATVVVLAIAAACGGDSPTGPGHSVVGTYSLRTVNGGPVPALLAADASGTVEITDDEFTLNADATYSEVGHLRTTLSDGTVVTSLEQDTGVYTATNGAVTLVSTLGTGQVSATVNGNTFTMIIAGWPFVYTR